MVIYLLLNYIYYIYNTIVLLPTVVINLIAKQAATIRADKQVKTIAKQAATIRADKQVKTTPDRTPSSSSSSSYVGTSLGTMIEHLQEIAISSALIAIISITFISYVIALHVMTKICGDGKYKYVPKRLRWNRERLRRTYGKVRTRVKTMGMALAIWCAINVGIRMNMVSDIRENKTTNCQRKYMANIPTICSFIGTTASATKPKPTRKHREIFDGDMFDMVIDSGCSYCITNDINHFIETPEQTNVAVKGIGGQVVKATMKGTVRWSFANDNGQIHDEYIHHTYYNADCSYCLYSPQHIAQQANDHHPKKNGTYSVTYADHMELYWDQGTQKRTVPIHPKLNVFVMTSSPAKHIFAAFCAKIDDIDNYHHDMASPTIQAMNSNIISDGESEGESDNENDDESMSGNKIQEETWAHNRRHPDLPNDVFQTMISEPTMKGTGKVHIIPTEDVEVQATTPQAKLLAWHYRLGHLPFGKIQQLAKRGDLPAAIATCPIPKCAACLYGKATRRPWRTRAPVNAMLVPPVVAPGSVVSVDQMVSAIPGLIPQMKGFITYKRYEIATIFVDHFSGLSFVHLQKGSSASETIEAKHAFERYAKVHGVSIKHYHADNGIFEAREFQDAIFTDGQTISFCGVNAHHQNGRAEKKIRDLQELTRTMILHAQNRWPNAISAHLWPMAMKSANENTNSAPSLDTGISPIEMFTQVQIAPKVKHAHTFGAPVYVLEERLQNQGGHVPKWDKRSNIGIYVGISPRHSRKVALVLNLETGHVSPQFHVGEEGNHNFHYYRYYY